MGTCVDFLNLCVFIFTSKDHRQKSARTEVQALRGVWCVLSDRAHAPSPGGLFDAHSLLPGLSRFTWPCRLWSRPSRGWPPEHPV